MNLRGPPVQPVPADTFVSDSHVFIERIDTILLTPT